MFSLLGIFRPVSNALYPRFSKMATSSKNEALLWGYRMLYVMGGLGLMAFLAVFFFAPYIVKIVLGSGYEPSIMVLRILAIFPLLIALTDVLNAQLMLPFGKDKIYTVINVLAGPVNIILAVFLVSQMAETGMAVALVLTELFIIVLTFLYLWHCQLTPFHYKCEDSLAKG